MRRDRTPTPPAPEPWNPDQWPAPEPANDAGVDTPVEPTDPADTTSAGEDDFTHIQSFTLPATNAPAEEPPAAPATRSWPRRRRGKTDGPKIFGSALSGSPVPNTPEADRAREGRRAQRSALIVGACALVIVVGAVVIIALILGLGRHSADNSSPAMLATPTPTAPASGAPAAADCPSTVNGPVTTGRDAGDQNSGPGVIKAFQYDYYVRRDAAAAHALTTPTARVGKAEDMQGFINALPPKTRHCLTITDQGKGVYGVELSEIPPGGGAPTVYKQNVQTTEADGKTWIVSIDPVDN
ncbi:hypothetical protein LH935_28260 (plasmid) [Gordonia polyisoprenivorans]|uniref:hypothetical protein n=1 Tax=Gordonia polyisoprenivorans TaxID=84595 RepID=UPI0022346266|nr:hypothetical protein LH935_28260 [Gordonia polyisoprenivorans]